MALDCLATTEPGSIVTNKASIDVFLEILVRRKVVCLHQVCGVFPLQVEEFKYLVYE